MTEPSRALHFWNSQPFLDAANILVASDEPLLALKLLEGLPGYYRDFPPQEIIELKKKIYRHLANAETYTTIAKIQGLDVIEDMFKHPQAGPFSLRFKALKTDVDNFNKKNIMPHILDYGAGNYWLPRTLKHFGCKFTYFDITHENNLRELFINENPELYVKKPEPSQPFIFFAGEILEHLYHEQDMAIALYKHTDCPDIIHISTPKYSYDTGPWRLDWENNVKDLGHVRTYTPQEFISAVVRMFPGMNYNYLDSTVMHVRGTKLPDIEKFEINWD